MTGKLELTLLGQADVRLNGQPLTGFYSGKAQALLFYLAVTWQTHTRPALAGLLWADMPEADALMNLRQVLTNLRKLVGYHLTITRQMVAFNRDSDYWLDVAAFQAGVDQWPSPQPSPRGREGLTSPPLEGSEGGPEVERLRQAVNLYQGDFLAGFYVRDAPVFEEWMLVQQARLRELALETLQKLTAYFARKGDYRHGVAYSRRLLALEPWHEETHRRLMLLLARSRQRRAALAQFQTCRQVLAEELGVEPSAETLALYHRIQAAKTAQRPNLPVQPTSFIGRQGEVAEIQHLLLDEPDCRLLTLVGPGGIGKTRLALAAATQAFETFPQEITFVSLAPIGEVEFVVPAIAEALHLTFYGQTDPKIQLLDYLRQKTLLLVVDNFEHLLDGANLLSDILSHAPHVTLLATSRERLNLREEWVYEVQGLPFPAGGDQTSEVLTSYSAVQLFLQRARQTEFGFTPSAAEMADIGRICQLVEGMPLGLELAAPWIRTLSCGEIAAEIERSLDFLTTPLRNMPERHRSLRVVFEQTWRWLSGAEQTVLRQLSVFRGGCTREAAERVTGATLAVLSSLVDKALLRRTNTGRYTIHELLRQYSEAELEVAGQVNTVRDAHSSYYIDFLYQREADLKGRRQVIALDEVEADFDNVRVAWQWAISCKNYGAVGRALESLFCFCNMRNRYQEILELLRLGREQLAPATGEQPHPVWGRVIARAPMAGRVFLEPLAEIRVRVETSLTIAREHGNQAEIAFCLWRLGQAVFNDNDDFTDALAYCEQSLAHYQALDDRYYLAQLLDNTGIWYLRLNQPERGTQLMQQSANLRRNLGDKIGLSHSLDSLAWIMYHSGHYAEAEANWQEGYHLSRETRERQEIAFMRMGFAWLRLFNRGDFVAVRALAEEVQTIALEVNSREGKRRAQILFGFLAGMAEDYTACRQFMQQAAYQRKFTYNIAWMMMGLCLAACGLGEMQTARQHLEQVLEMSRVRTWPAVMAQCLPFAAIIKANAGEAGRAVELLGLAFHHPLSPKGWLEKWPLLTRLRAELEVALSPAIFATAWERGQALDLEATIQTLLEELS